MPEQALAEHCEKIFLAHKLEEEPKVREVLLFSVAVDYDAMHKEDSALAVNFALCTREYGWSIAQDKSKYSQFKCAVARPEGCLLAVSFFGAHMVVNLQEINVRRDVCPSDLVKCLANEGQGLES